MFSHENGGQLVESPLGGHLEAREQKQHDLVQCHSSPLFSPKGSSSHRDASIKRKSKKLMARIFLF